MNYNSVLITGGAGFIGGNLVNHLTHMGIKCVVVDDLSTGHMGNIDLENDFIEFIKADVGDSQVLKPLVAKSSMIIHLAAVVGMKNVIENPLKAVSTNIDAFHSIIKLASEHKTPLVYISSSAVYPSQSISQIEVLSESMEVHYNGNHPASIYSETKLIGESLCNIYGRSFGLEYIIVRPFNLIGLGQMSEYGMVVPNFIKSAINNQSLYIYGDGQQMRSFSDIGLAVRLLWNLIERTPFSGQIVNLATNDKAITILELADLIGRITERNIDLKFVPYSEAHGDGFIDISHRKPDLSRLKSIVGEWQPISLETIISNIYEYEVSRKNVEANCP